MNPITAEPPSPARIIALAKLVLISVSVKASKIIIVKPPIITARDKIIDFDFLDILGITLMVNKSIGQL